MAQRAFYLVLHNSLYGPDSAVNYDYVVTKSTNSLLTGTRHIPNGTHTDHCWANLANASKRVKNSDIYKYILYIIMYNICI